MNLEQEDEARFEFGLSVEKGEANKKSPEFLPPPLAKAEPGLFIESNIIMFFGKEKRKFKINKKIIMATKQQSSSSIGDWYMTKLDTNPILTKVSNRLANRAIKK